MRTLNIGSKKYTKVEATDEKEFNANHSYQVYTSHIPNAVLANFPPRPGLIKRIGLRITMVKLLEIKGISDFWAKKSFKIPPWLCALKDRGIQQEIDFIDRMLSGGAMVQVSSTTITRWHP